MDKLLKAKMRGRWKHFFYDHAPELTLAIGNAPEHVACPSKAHRASKDGFRLFANFQETGGGVCNSCGAHANGISLFAWLRNTPMAAAERTISDWVNKELGSATPRQAEADASSAPLATTDEARREALELVLDGCLPSVPESVVHRYLSKRGLSLLDGVPDSLLYHPGLAYWTRFTRADGSKGFKNMGNYPVMIAKVVDQDRGLVSLHRTYLYFDGSKAQVTEVKKLMPKCAPFQGAAIRLVDRDGPVLHIAEGIETCLAVMEIAETGSFWAGINATLIEQLEVPGHIKEVNIWGDLDTSLLNEAGQEIGYRGQRAAMTLAKKLLRQGLQVRVLLPDVGVAQGEQKLDWLDMLNQRSVFTLRHEFLAKSV